MPLTAQSNFEDQRFGMGPISLGRTPVLAWPAGYALLVGALKALVPESLSFGSVGTDTVCFTDGLAKLEN